MKAQRPKNMVKSTHLANYVWPIWNIDQRANIHLKLILLKLLQSMCMSNTPILSCSWIPFLTSRAINKLWASIILEFQSEVESQRRPFSHELFFAEPVESHSTHAIQIPSDKGRTIIVFWANENPHGLECELQCMFQTLYKWTTGVYYYYFPITAWHL